MVDVKELSYNDMASEVLKFGIYKDPKITVDLPKFSFWDFHVLDLSKPEVIDELNRTCKIYYYGRLLMERGKSGTSSLVDAVEWNLDNVKFARYYSSCFSDREILGYRLTWQELEELAAKGKDAEIGEWLFIKKESMQKLLKLKDAKDKQSIESLLKNKFI